MSDRSSRPYSAHRRPRRRGASGADELATGLCLRIRMLWALCVLSAAGVVGAVWAGHVVLGLPMGWALAGAAGGCCVVLLSGDRRGAALLRALGEHEQKLLQQQAAERQRLLGWLQHVETLVARGRTALQDTAGSDAAGDGGQAGGLGPGQPAADDPFAAVVHAVGAAQREALDAVRSLAAGRRRALREAEQGEAILYGARRLHALIGRTLAALSELERNTDDPLLMHALFDIDHLVTLTRRSVESLAVLGGETARRVVRPLPLTVVLRQAAAEIEQYGRVRVQWPDRGRDLTVPGHVGPSLIHILNELAENGTRFSSPEAKVLLRVAEVAAGLVIEVEDRGLHMSPAKLTRLNRMLDTPQETDLRERLREGSIGLLVVARLARMHGIRVQLRPNLLGGTQALVVVPTALLLPPEPAPPPVAAAAAVPARTSAAAPLAAAAETVAVGAAGLVPPGDPVAPGAAGQIPGRGTVGEAALPQRRSSRIRASGDAAPAQAAGAKPGSEVVLPRRGDRAPGAQLPTPPAHRAPSGPPRPDLMAAYTGGVQRGTQEAAPGDDAG